jgi:hypothetical protein
MAYVLAVALAVLVVTFISLGYMTKKYAFAPLPAEVKIPDYPANATEIEHEEYFAALGFRKVVQAAHWACLRRGFWQDLETGKSLIGKRNMGELLALVHSEVSEALQGHRTNAMDEKLPHRPALEVELADAVIRIADIAGAHNLDVAGAIQEKLRYNATRPDFNIENRKGPNGKKY